MDFTHSFKNIKLLLLEIDGVMTDGRTWLDAKGQWRRQFSVRDSMSLRRLRKLGYKTAVLSLGHEADVREHMQMLSIDFFYEDCADKFAGFRRLLEESALTPDEIAVMSFDPDDRPLLKEVGFSATVPSAGQELQTSVDFVVESDGGDGAVREICNYLFQYGYFAAQTNVKKIAGL